MGQQALPSRSGPHLLAPHQQALAQGVFQRLDGSGLHARCFCFGVCVDLLGGVKHQGRGTQKPLKCLPAIVVALYWQHWAREAPSAQRLTEAVKSAARLHLRQVKDY